MATLGDLVIKMSLDAAGFQSDMGKAAYQAEKGMAQIVAAGNVAANVITGFAKEAVRGIVELATALPDISRQVFEQVDALSEAAEAAGVTAQAYQTLQTAAQLAGVGAEQFGTALSKLNRNIVEAAEGSPKIAAAFERLGVAVTDAQGRLRSTEDVFKDLNKAFQAFPAGPEEAALAMEILGKAGARMLPALNADMQALEKTAQELGATFSNELLAASADFEKSSAQLDLALQGVRNTIAEGMLPVMSMFNDAMVEVIKSFLGVEDRAKAVVELREQMVGMLKAVAYGAALVVDVFATLRDMWLTVTDAIIVQIAAWNVLDRAMHLDWQGVKNGLASVRTELELLTTNLQKRLDREPLRVKVEAAFAQAETNMRTRLAQPPAAAQTFGGTRVGTRAKNIKDGADKAARELEAAERRLRQLEERNAREAQQQHQKELDEMLKAWNEEARAQEAADKRLQQLAEKNAEELQRQHEKELDDMLRQMEEAKRVREQYEEIFTGSLADAMVDIVEGTKSVSEAFADMGKSIAHSIAQIAAKKLATQLAEGLFGTAGDAGSWWGTIAGVMGGGRAFGGSFQAGQVIKVGERGPEYIRPLTAGYVEPMQAAKTENNTVSVNMSIATPDAASFRRSEGQILTSMGLATQRALARR